MSGLFIVATPIGNLEDITLRALRILREVDLILCEDTRVTKRLLAKYDIVTPTLSYHQHSGQLKVDKVLALLREEKDIALVTDAGTPGIADPGNELIARILETPHRSVSTKIIPIPGPAAIITALSIAGVPTDRFSFMGFLPHKKGRQTMVKAIVASTQTVVVYESCHRIEKFLKELQEHGGEGLQLVVCRELTKLFESVYRGRPQEILEVLESDVKNVKGEFVVVIG